MSENEEQTKLMCEVELCGEIYMTYLILPLCWGDPLGWWTVLGGTLGGSGPPFFLYQAIYKQQHQNMSFLY